MADSPRSVKNDANIVTNQTFRGFEDKYTRFSKVPDHALLSRETDGIIEPKFILEVGLSETHEQLVQDAKLWLVMSQWLYSQNLPKIRNTGALFLT
jgi:hypothetical protein